MNRHCFREKQRRAREEAILEAASELMASKEYASLTMDELAAALGVSKATLYQHFASKEELLLHVVLRRVQHVQALIAALDFSQPALALLEKILDAILEARFGEGRPNMGDAMLNLLPFILAHPLYQARFEEVSNVLAELIRRAQKEGDAPAHLSPFAVIQVLFGLVRNPVYEHALKTGGCTPGELRQAIRDLFFDGLRARR